jgi:hypothetical protein
LTTLYGDEQGGLNRPQKLPWKLVRPIPGPHILSFGTCPVMKEIPHDLFLLAANPPKGGIAKKAESPTHARV